MAMLFSSDDGLPSPPPFHMNCRCVLFVPKPTLRCDACGQERIIDGLTIIGEIYGCAQLGAFRLHNPLIKDLR